MQKKVFCNWKMYLGAEEAQTLAAELADRFADSTGIAVFPSFEVLSSIGPIFEGTEILLGAQNCSEQLPGPHTGEVSARNIRDIGCHYVLVGHSERRRMGESDTQIAQKMSAAINAGLTPVLCVGESESERHAARSHEVVKEQITQATHGLNEADYVIAYEPIWAISNGMSGNPATPDDAAQMCAYIKRTFGEGIITLYGGSVDESNVAQYTAHASIEGFLVGSASTKSEKLFPLLRALN